MIIGITGSDGFVGWHLKCRLFAEGAQFVTATRETFSSPEALASFADSVDVVVHAAGVNRADSEEEVVTGNLSIADSLIAACRAAANPPGIVYTNSVKAQTGGFYGDAKAEVATRLSKYATDAGTFCTDVQLPHLFGEFGVPFYNSAVATFAYQLAQGATSQVSGGGELSLLHVQRACEFILGAARDSIDNVVQPEGVNIGVSACYSRMQRLSAYVETGIVPDMNGCPLDLQLFNTIRSQMWPDAYPMDLLLHQDARGAFFEVVRAHGQGQTSISTTAPGVTRGEHFHFDKVERFAVISGQARIRVRRLFTSEVHTFDVSGSAPVFIDMPPLCTHDITNTGNDELVTLFWSHDHFDPTAADTYPAAVEGIEQPS